MLAICNWFHRFNVRGVERVAAIAETSKQFMGDASSRGIDPIESQFATARKLLGRFDRFFLSNF